MGLLNQETLKKLHEVELEILLEIDRICKENNLVYYLNVGTLLGAVRHGGFIPWDDDLDISMPRKDYEVFQKLCRTELAERFYLDNYKTSRSYDLPFSKIRKKGTVFLEEDKKAIADGRDGIWVDIFPLDNANKSKSLFQAGQRKIIYLLRGAIHRNIHGILDTDDWKRKLAYSSLYWLPRHTLLKVIDFVMRLNSDEHAAYYINFGNRSLEKNLVTEKSRFEPAIELSFEGHFFAAPHDYDYILKQFYGDDYMILPPVAKRRQHDPLFLNFENDDSPINKGTS